MNQLNIKANIKRYEDAIEANPDDYGMVAMMKAQIVSLKRELSQPARDTAAQFWAEVEARHAAVLEDAQESSEDVTKRGRKKKEAE